MLSPHNVLVLSDLDLTMDIQATPQILGKIWTFPSFLLHLSSYLQLLFHSSSTLLVEGGPCLPFLCLLELLACHMQLCPKVSIFIYVYSWTLLYYKTALPMYSTLLQMQICQFWLLWLVDCLQQELTMCVCNMLQSFFQPPLEELAYQHVRFSVVLDYWFHHGLCFW